MHMGKVSSLIIDHALSFSCPAPDHGPRATCIDVRCFTRLHKIDCLRAGSSARPFSARARRSLKGRGDLLLDGACATATLTWRAIIDGVSFASSDFKLRMCAHLFLAGIGYRWNRLTACSGFWRLQLPLVLKSGRRRG